MEKSKAVLMEAVRLHGSLADSCKRNQRTVLKTGYETTSIRSVMKMRGK